MNTRFLNSVIATAQTTDVQMPWDRRARAQRRASRAAKVVILAERRALLARAA